jgi:hypothetical protein
MSDLCLANLVRSISVLNVGDGACSVLRERSSSDGCCGRTAIIDCGSYRGRAQSAADLLAHHLAVEDWRSLSELVVTHFDADHWEGLLRVVDSAPVTWDGVSPDLRIFFPAVPFGVDLRLPSTVMTFITTVGPSGVQALDLRRAWRTLTRAQLIPLARGDGFSLAGRLHEVVWPPRRLDSPFTQRLNRVVQDIEEFAERLADDGHPRLRESLRIYQNGAHDRRPVRYGRSDKDLSDWEQPALGDEEAYEETDGLLPQEVLEPAIPRDRVRDPEFRRLYRQAREAQNDLSLVFHDPVKASLLVFGDAPPRIVEYVRRELSADGYQVALAPHHGSWPLLHSAPHAETCVSQGGEERRKHWEDHTRSHLNHGRCVHTHDEGNICRDMR